jgi:hypothetical protein
MTLANPKLTKLGTTTLNSGNGIGNVSVASGFTQFCLVQPTTALPNPGPRNLADPTWVSRNMQYLESTQVTAKYSQDWE